MSECASKGCGCTTEPIIQPTAPAPLATGSAQAVYRIENMDCPTEEALIRSKLAGLAGVAGLEFNLMQRTLAVRHELPSLSPVEQALKAIGMQAVRMDQASAEQTTKLSIAKMDCPTEETLIRNKLGTVAGVADLDFNLMQRTLSVRHANQVLPDVLVALQALGFEAQVVDTAEVASPSAAPVTTPTNWWPLGISLVTASAAEAVYWLHNGNHWSVVVLALVAVFTGGLSTYKKGWIALKNRNLNMNALMSIAVTGAMLIGHWPEAAMVMVLFALAEVIEAKSLDRARNAIRGLLDLTPEQATVQQADGTWREVGAKQITIGARVRVKPGERIALDGEVLEGRSAVNQAPITGESLPVEKSPGDSVFAGTINESGSFEYRVTALANNSTLARIIHAVEAAQGSRAPTQRFVDQFARWYTPVVFGVAIAVALLPPLFMGAAWLDWIYRALVLLVVACPCALVISTPVSIVSGLPRHSHQRWRLSGRRPQAALAGSGQDRHDHARQARTDRLCHMGQCTRLGQPQHRCQSGGPLGPSCIQGGGTGRADGRGCLARRGRIQRAARSGCARPNQRCDLPSGQPPDARRAGAVHTRAGAAHRCAGNRWQDRRDVGRRKGGTCLIRRSGHHQGQQQDRHRRAARTGHQHHDADRRQPPYGTGHCRTSRNRPCARQPTPR